MGRPTLYAPEIADEICRRLAGGESLNTIVKDDGLPANTTVYRWLGSHEDFREKYARARETQMESMAEEIMSISDEQPMMTVKGEDWSRDSVDPAGVQRNKLRVDTRKWLMSKMAPKKYGDKVTTALTDGEGGPLKVVFERIAPNANV